MCTLSVHHAKHDILVTMNRDETISRAPESPPAIHRMDNGVTWVAPIDGEKGGTWMGANDRGVIACLLNFYLPGESLLPDTTGQYRTRGEIIPRALERGSGDAVVSWLLEDFDPSAYPSFDLHVISRDGVRRFMWLKKGPLELAEIEGEWNVFSSSGWDSADVMRWRETRFAAWIERGQPKSGALPLFHILQEAGREDYSPLMKRAWSSTRSITQAGFSPCGREIVMRYWAQPRVDSNEPTSVHTLPLANAYAPSQKAKAP